MFLIISFFWGSPPHQISIDSICEHCPNPASNCKLLAPKEPPLRQWYLNCPALKPLIDCHWIEGRCWGLGCFDKPWKLEKSRGLRLRFVRALLVDIIPMQRRITTNICCNREKATWKLENYIVQTNGVWYSKLIRWRCLECDSACSWKIWWKIGGNWCLFTTVKHRKFR